MVSPQPPFGATTEELEDGVDERRLTTGLRLRPLRGLRPNWPRASGLGAQDLFERRKRVLETEVIGPVRSPETLEDI